MFQNSGFVYFFFAQFTRATGSVSTSSPYWYSTLSGYCVAPGSMLASPKKSQIIDMYKLSREQLGLRWGRLPNTYLLISSVRLDITGENVQSAFAQYSDLRSTEGPFKAIQSSATVRKRQQIYQANHRFLVMILIPASVSLFCAIPGPWQMHQRSV